MRRRNKIQDRWSTRVHKVVEPLANGTYVIEPADGHGNTRVVGRSEMQVCPPTVLQRPATRAVRHRDTAPPPPPLSTDTSEEDDGDMAIDIIPLPPSYADWGPTEPTSDDDSVGDSEDSDKDEVTPLRRSTQTTAGHHSNRFHLPLSSLHR